MSEAGAVPTPPAEHLSMIYASYVSHDLKYSADFENGIMQAALEASTPSFTQSGIHVISEGSDEEPIDGISVRAVDLSPHSLPTINEDELPLSLDDPRRIFASPLPGVKLTHPGGYLEGGPGLDPEMDTFAEDFFSRNPHIRTLQQLRVAQEKEIESHKSDLRQKMLHRQQAKEKNAQIEKDLERLRERHVMESKIQQRQADERRERKAAKEKRRAGREALAAG